MGFGMGIVSVMFFGCQKSFLKIDQSEKANVIQQNAVFGGQGKYIYVYNKSRLVSLEDAASGNEGSIPTQGPNGETVIVLGQPGVLSPQSGYLPAGSAAYGSTSVVNGVAQGPNYYSQSTVTVTSNTDNGDLFAMASLFGAMLGAIGALGTGESSVESASYSSTDGSASVPSYQSYYPNSYTMPYTEGVDLEYLSSGIPQCADLSNLQGDLNYLNGKCHSPLLIAFAADDQFKKFELTNPLKDGRWFDIAGDNARPMAHAKEKISWHRNSNYMFIVLPDENGAVLGIDQLFGNNTRGPDGQFGKNGYEALRKWDDNKDGLITAEDSIFPRLRLWSDRNFDAVAASDELLPLSGKGVTVIDLHYDSNYIEVDPYGNMTALKSVVKTSEGQLHLLFDLWFYAREMKDEGGESAR